MTQPYYCRAHKSRSLNWDWVNTYKIFYRKLEFKPLSMIVRKYNMLVVSYGQKSHFLYWVKEEISCLKDLRICSNLVSRLRSWFSFLTISTVRNHTLYKKDRFQPNFWRFSKLQLWKKNKMNQLIQKLCQSKHLIEILYHFMYSMHFYASSKLRKLLHKLALIVLKCKNLKWRRFAHLAIPFRITLGM